MQTSLSNVFNKLKSLSDATDSKIYEHNKENHQINNWFKIIEETANAIVEETPKKKSKKIQQENSSPQQIDGVIPDLVLLIAGEQKDKKHRISTLLVGMQKDHVKHNSRKSRCSIRKLVLGKRSGSRWEVSNSNNSYHGSNSKLSGNNSKTSKLSRSNGNSSKLSESNEIKLNNLRTTLLQSSNEKNLKLSSLQNSNTSFKRDLTIVLDAKEDDYSTPTQHHEILEPNTNETMTYQYKLLNPTLENDIATPNNFTTPESQVNVTNKSLNDETETYSTPTNQQLIGDSENLTAATTANTKATVTHVKRKSSVQLTQEKVKKAKNILISSQEKKPLRTARILHEDHRSSKKVKQSKNSAVIQPKISNGMNQQAAVKNENRILREIQKKEEIVNQNARKLRSLRQMKIEENKKTREQKMEKAMQQRMKIEKEKEERIKCRTLSKQENIQKDTSNKKTAQKRGQKQEDFGGDKKMGPSSTKKVLNTSVSNTECKNEPISLKKAPPKPVRTPAKKIKITSDANAISKAALVSQTNETFSSHPTEEHSSSTEKEIFAKPALNTTYISSPITKGKPLTSTPATSKIESKVGTKTPINAIHKSNSYTMTPSESSFVNYDISEIKSDDDDEEEEEVNHKPIPPWASGISLRNALLSQYYDSGNINTDEIFGNYFETPDLEAIMGTQKKHYIKRTSSAIWLNSPNRSILA